MPCRCLGRCMSHHTPHQRPVMAPSSAPTVRSGPSRAAMPLWALVVLAMMLTLVSIGNAASAGVVPRTATWQWDALPACGGTQIGGSGELFLRYSELPAIPGNGSAETRVQLMGRAHVHSVYYDTLQWLVPGSGAPLRETACAVTAVSSGLPVSVKVSGPSGWSADLTRGPVLWFPAKFGGVVDIECEWSTDEPDVVVEDIPWECVSDDAETMAVKGRARQV